MQPQQRDSTSKGKCRARLSECRHVAALSRLDLVLSDDAHEAAHGLPGALERVVQPQKVRDLHNTAAQSGICLYGAASATRHAQVTNTTPHNVGDVKVCLQAQASTCKAQLHRIARCCIASGLTVLEARASQRADPPSTCVGRQQRQ